MLTGILGLIKTISGIGFLLSITVKLLLNIYLDYSGAGSVNLMLYVYAPRLLFKKYPNSVHTKYNIAKSLCDYCLYSFWMFLVMNFIVGTILLFIR